MLVTIYDLCHLALPGAGLDALKAGYARLFFRSVRRKADAVITISQFTKDEFLRLTPQRHQPVIPIHLAVNESWFDAASLREWLHLAELRFCSYVGRP